MNHGSVSKSNNSNGTTAVTGVMLAVIVMICIIYIFMVHYLIAKNNKHILDSQSLSLQHHLWQMNSRIQCFTIHHHPVLIHNNQQGMVPCNHLVNYAKEPTGTVFRQQNVTELPDELPETTTC